MLRVVKLYITLRDRGRYELKCYFTRKETESRLILLQLGELLKQRWR